MYFLHLNGTQVGPYSIEQLRTYWKNGEVTGQSLYWQEGMPNWLPLDSIKDLFVETSSARAIGGFWRRLCAYLLDSLLLGLVGFVLGLFFFNLFCRIGGWGLLIGYIIGLLYFGLLNSTLGRGQTLGKRLLKLEVVDRNNHHLSPGRSFLRYFIFSLPFYLNGVITYGGFVATSWTVLFLSFLVVSLGGAIAYLYVFNRRTRQSLHDLTVGSYVVQAAPSGGVEAAPLWKGHLIALGCLLLLTAGLAIASLFLIHVPFFEKMLVVQEAITSTGKVNSVSVSEGVNSMTFNGNTRTAKVFSVQAYWKGRPDDIESAASEIAAIVLKTYPEVKKDDKLSITISSGYHLGIFSSSLSQVVSYSPEKWEQLISPASP